MPETAAPPLIKTKLFTPQVRVELVGRARLITALNEGLRYPLVLVSSQAGSGKTTALAQWVDQLKVPSAWLSIDEGDNDLPCFLAYLCAALGQVVPGAGLAALEILQSPEPPPVDYVLTGLINDLSEAPGDFALVLDDYHLIRSTSIRRAVAFLIDHMPACMHLVIATRMDPGLPLARLRARNKIFELRMEQMRFTPEETAQYFNRILRLGLSEDDLGALLERTEGWIASLQMAALSLRNLPDSGAFIRAFSGSNRYVLDYLVEEVLNLQPEHVQAFLLQTCLLDRLCGPLCDAVVQPESSPGGLPLAEPGGSSAPGAGAPSQAMLEFLERSNLFIVPLDQERVWFRYHHLFADLLRARLAHLSASKTGKPAGFSKEDLHRRASAWYESSGLVEEAIQHALSGADYPQAARLIELAAEKTWLNGDYGRLQGWIRTLPADLVQARPWLCMWQAWVYTQAGTLQDALVWIDLAEQAVQKQSQALPAASAADLQRELTTLKALAACLAQDYDRAVALSAIVLENPPEGEKKSAIFARCNILHGLSSLYYAAGELSKAEGVCLETLRVAGESGFFLRYVHAASKLSHVCQVRGQLHRAEEVLHAALSFLERHGRPDYFAASMLHCRLGSLYYEWNRVEDAERLLEKNLAPGDASEIPYVRVYSYNEMGRLRLSRRDFSGAQDALDRAKSLTHEAYIWPALLWAIQSMQVRLWLDRGEIAQAAELVSEHRYAGTGEIPFSCESNEIDHARVLLAQGSCKEAALLLQRLADAARTRDRKGSLVGIGSLAALAHWADNDSSASFTLLEEALALAEPEGYVRTFIDAGQPMAALLSAFVHAGSAPGRAYAGRLLSAFEGAKTLAQGDGRLAAAPADYPVPAAEALPEPLTERELEVLGLIAAGLSNGEIALRLVVAMSTVKRHVNHIFGKLGVDTRTRALARARELRLIQS